MKRKRRLRLSRLIFAFIFVQITIPLYAVDLSKDVFYEIFVRSFQDSGSDGKGDLSGVTSRLDYISSLGATGIWLTPIFKSPSDHGYDAIDFRSINPDFGTFDDFKNLVSAAHSRHLKVILDIAVNHTSKDHPWFISASQSTQSPFRDDYVWRDADPHWKFPGRWTQLGSQFYYSRFSPKLPDLNWHNPAVLEEVKSILHFWANLGVDGFRLDAARYYIEGPNGEPDTLENHQMLQAFAEDLRRDFPNTFFIGEVWADSKTISTYIDSKKELDLAFNFPVSAALIASLESNSADELEAEIKKSIAVEKFPSGYAPFLTNHDMPRIASMLRFDPKKLRLAADLIFSFPGTPIIYYGEEIGMGDEIANKVPASDHIQRRPMIWSRDANHQFTTVDSAPWLPFANLPAEGSVADQESNPNSLLSHYRGLLKLRSETESLQSSDLILLESPAPNVLAFMRTGIQGSTLILANFSKDNLAKIAVKIPTSKNFETSKTIFGSGQSKFLDRNFNALEINHLNSLESVFVHLGKNAK